MTFEEILINFLHTMQKQEVSIYEIQCSQTLINKLANEFGPRLVNFADCKEIPIKEIKFAGPTNWVLIKSKKE